MQTLEISVEPTAHPRARKFILERDVRTGDAIGFADPERCKHVPLATALLAVPGVSDAHFAQNVITITSARGADWGQIEEKARAVIAERIDAHDPAMKDAGAPIRATVGHVAAIDSILEQTIRPYIRSHGGEIDVLEYDAATKRLLVTYQGTCGSCPASTSGTLEAIQQILRDEFDPELLVEIV